MALGSKRTSVCNSRFSVGASPSTAARSGERNAQAGVGLLPLSRFILPVTAGRKHRVAERVRALCALVWQWILVKLRNFRHSKNLK